VKKIKILLIIVVLFIVSSTIVLAKSGTTTTDSVNLRNKPSTSSDVIKSLSKNESLEILEESGDFYKVLYKGRVGYVSKKFVSVAGESASTNTIETTNTTSSTNTTTSTTNVTTTAANSDNSNLAIGSYKLSADSDVYVLPVLYALKNGSLKKGDTVNIITVTANWVYISNNNISGWVFKTSIDGVDKEKTTTTTTTTEATTTTENVVTVNTDAVNIREKPSTSSDILGSVGKGRKLEVISKSGDWTQVQFNKVKGYVLSKFVS
jgi:SH3 domain protein